MKKVSTLFLLLCLPFLGSAQIAFGPRFEQTHSNRTIDYTVISNKEAGVVVLQKEFTQAPEYPVIVKYFNLDLELQWQKTIDVPQQFFIYTYYYHNNKNYLFFKDPIYKRLMLVVVDVQQGTITGTEIEKLDNMEISEIQMVRNSVVMGGSFDIKPIVVVYDTETKMTKTLQNLHQSDARLLEIKVNQDSTTFNVLISRPNERGDPTISVHTYDFEGNTVRDYELELKPHYRLIKGVSSSIYDKSQMVIGTYGYKSRNSMAGIFVNHIDRTGKQTMTYHNLGALPKFLDYMGEKQATKLKSKARALQRAGKELRFRRGFYFREVVEQDDKLMIYGQVRDQNGPTHIYTMQFDREGKLEWDDFLSKDETKPGWGRNLGKCLWFGEAQGACLNYYSRELYLRYMDRTQEHEVFKSELKLSEPEDEVRFERDFTSGAEPWYDNHFLVFGVHDIRPKDKSFKMRTVFFINKVSAVRDAKAALSQD